MSKHQEVIAFTRTFSMPSASTFSMKPVRELVERYRKNSTFSIDPFCGNSLLATHRNDLNPKLSAIALDAEEYCRALKGQRQWFDLAFFDPPYSPRQISECYSGIGMKAGIKETQNGHFYRRVRDALDEILLPHAFVISFGWNSAGMGKKRGYQLREIHLVNHGGAHNDTICMVEQKLESSQ